MEEEAVYQIALTKIPTVGYVHSKLLLERFGSATAVFNASKTALQSLEGIGEIRAKNIHQFKDFNECQLLLRKSRDKNIRLIGYLDPEYPLQLKECYDPPSLLYYKGDCSLNASRSIAIIGTRNHTEYGRKTTADLIHALKPTDLTIISGMAYGIDGLAHRTALQAGLPTIGVLAHGLDHIYPSLHTSLSKEILDKGGGLLSEFPLGTKAERHHFPIRNRIVAGISKAVLIIETGIRGGSMITAGIANSYNLPVFALPARISDKSSNGCLQLIRTNKALVFTGVAEFLTEMQWSVNSGNTTSSQQLSLIPELDTAATLLLNLLGKHAVLQLEQLYILSGLSAGIASKAVLDLELNGIIKLLPGRRYTLA